jgi:CelD/BcsL family acetyltransferase involved in cellulose biosynthesis
MLKIGGKFALSRYMLDMKQAVSPARGRQKMRSGAVPNDRSAPVSLPHGASLSIVNSPAGLKSLEAGWRQLEAQLQRSVSVFQSFDWLDSWSRTYASEGSSIELMVVAGYQDRELVFVWPLMKSRSKGMAVLSWLSEPAAQYGDVLINAEHSAPHWAAAAVQLLSQQRGIDLIRLRHVRSDSNITQVAEKQFKCARMQERAPYLDLEIYPDDASYEARYTSEQRKRRKKIRKGLEKIGPVEFRSLPAGSLADAAILSAVEEKNAWLKQRGRMNLVLNSPRHLEFLKHLSRRSGGKVEVVTSELVAGGQPVSWEIGFRYNNVHFAYVTSHVNAWTDLSPGRLHMDLSQRKAIADGMKRFDLMVPYDPHKESWCSGMVETRDFFYPLSAKGWAYGELYLRRIRPWARDLYYRLPRWALVTLQAVTGH